MLTLYFIGDFSTWYFSSMACAYMQDVIDNFIEKGLYLWFFGGLLDLSAPWSISSNDLIDFIFKILTNSKNPTFKDLNIINRIEEFKNKIKRFIKSEKWPEFITRHIDFNNEVLFSTPTSSTYRKISSTYRKISYIHMKTPHTF